MGFLQYGFACGRHYCRGIALFSLYALIGTFSESRASNVANEP
jgi:hypothetical protein